MSKIFFVAICAVASFVGGISAQYSGSQNRSTQLLFNDSIVVNPGQRLALDCGLGGGKEVRSCIWEKGDETFQVQDIYVGRHAGMSKPEPPIYPENKCGIVIDVVSLEDNGKWICKVLVPLNVLEGNRNIVVTVAPARPIMSYINEYTFPSPLVLTEDEEIIINCTVPTARPAARIRWFIGTEDVTYRSSSNSSNTEDLGCREPCYKTVSTLVYKFHRSQGGLNLRCKVEHQSLEEPEYSETNLDIQFKPYRISDLIFYGAPMDNGYEIKFNFTSNPKSHIRWYKDDVRITMLDDGERYTADNYKTFENNIYMATLYIDKFTKNDANGTFRLYANNGLGEEDFVISLRLTPPDVPDSGNGMIITTVIIVILIFVLLFIIAVMKYKQMCCFNSKDRIKNHMKNEDELKEEHDTESSSLPGNVAKKTSAIDILKNIKSKFPLSSRKTAKEPNLNNIEERDKEESEPIEVKMNAVDVYAVLETRKR